MTWVQGDPPQVPSFGGFGAAMADADTQVRWQQFLRLHVLALACSRHYQPHGYKDDATLVPSGTKDQITATADWMLRYIERGEL